jgi:universal stress protein A
MLSIRRILHPTDFSANSAAALKVACSLAHDHGAELVLAHVTQVPLPMVAEGLVTIVAPPDYDVIRQQIKQVPIDDPTLTVERIDLLGDAATEILQLATDKNCDLIVLGTHGRTGLKRLLMGSVAEEVVRKANCPVLTVKTPPPTANLREAEAAAAAS